MVNQIVDGIIKAIRVHFDDEYTIYTDSIEQDLKKPCFFIFNLNSDRQRKLKDRHKQLHFFDIQYIPKNNSEPRVEFGEVSSILMESLEYIQIDGGLLQTFEISCETIDGVLHCFVEYPLFTKKVTQEQMMLEKEVKGMVKND